LLRTAFDQNHFALFGLPQRFRLEREALDQAWRAVAAEVHPDRFAHAGEAEKRVALMLSTQVNEAYRTLKSPLSRARYLLSLNNVDTQEESNTSMPGDFLMAQIEWREAIEDAQAATDTGALEKLAGDLRQETARMLEQLELALDQQADLDLATLLVRKCRFMEKLEQEIDEAIETILS
jgi:molecular chaperone HscB